jgi:glycosyltransferase involved in cell wall biosynthesis
MMSNLLKISVVIPSFNPGPFLIEAVESINSSARQPTEIIIVDDCSSDGVSFPIAKDLESRFSNVIVLQSHRNIGAMHARKLGIENTSQEYIFCLDADDYLESNALEVALNHIGDHDACLLDQWVFSGVKAWLDIDLSKLDFPLSGKDAGALTLNGWQIHARAIYKKEVYLNAYQFIDHSSYANADEVLTRYFISNTRTIVRCDKKYMFRINPSSTTRALSSKTISVAHCFKDIYQFANINGYLNTKNYYEGYIWSDAVRFFWFLRSNKVTWQKMGVWQDAQQAIKDNLLIVSAWKANGIFWKIKKGIFFKLKTFMRYYWLMIEYKLII